MPEAYFSTCIPNFNDAQYIGQPVSSILVQRFDDFEIILSDNAGTDGSVKLIRPPADLRIKRRAR